jgi:hypothetical protein
MKKIKSILLSLLLIITTTLTGQTFTSDMDKYPIDSLKGFNESEIRERLKFNNVVGQELENHIKQLKRDYINQKFFIVRREDEKSN